MKKIILMLIATLLLISCGTSKANYEFDKESVITQAELESYAKTYNEEAKGKSVAFGAEIFNTVSNQDGFNYYQVKLDPINYDLDVMIGVPEEEETFKDGEYVIVEGVIIGESVGENMLGGEISNLMISTSSIKKSNFVEAVAPSLKTISVNQEQDQNDLKVVIEKIEFSEHDTRLYIEANNNSDSKISIYTFNITLVAGGKNYKEEYFYEADYEELDSELQPGTSSSGIVSLSPIDYENIGDITIVVDAPYSDNWDIDFEDYTFNISE